MQRPSPSPDGGGNPIFHTLAERHGAGSWISLETFVEAALYLPEHGYYRRPRERVGYRADRDFYTASSLGPVFSNLVLTSIDKLLPENRDDYSFVELGAEPSRHLLSDSNHGFADHRVVRIGEPFQLEGPCVVFSNELFDAQPFRRFGFFSGCWHEIGVRLCGGQPLLEPVSLGENPPAFLPASAPEGYRLDYPSGAARIAEAIAGDPWHGLFVAFDYGLPWSELSGNRPVGTGRTYHHHHQGTDLLESPGNRDITHHICWDHLSDILLENGFSAPCLESQEAFFMHHAVTEIARLIEAGAGEWSPERQTLKELIHPRNMGSKFQVLHAIRTDRVES